MASSVLDPMPSALRTGLTQVVLTAGAGSSFPSHEMASPERWEASQLQVERVCT